MAFETDPVFGLDVPTACPGVPADVLKPRSTWADRAAYDAQAAKLARMFAENFKTFERASRRPGARATGPGRA